MYQEILDVLKQRGRTRFTLESESGKVCLMGARNIVKYGRAKPLDHHGVCDEKMAHNYDDLTALVNIVGSPYGWNDTTDDQTVFSVLEVPSSRGKS